MKITLGSEVRDTITGFTGIVVARCEWLYGCVRITVQPKQLHDGKPVDYVTFDEDQLEPVVAEKEKQRPVTGSFDRPNPTRASQESR